MSGDVPVPSTPKSGSVGFDVLDVAAPRFEPDLELELGRIVLAADADELTSLWGEVGSTRPLPPVDFERQLVVALLYGGSGSCREHVAGIDVDWEKRTATAVFALALPFDMCTSDLNLRYHVVAVDLADLEPGTLTFTRRAELPDERVRPVTVEITDAAGDVAATTSPPPVEDVRDPTGAVPLPPAGEAISGRLDDGLPVWVVHHADDTVTVVEAIAPSGPNAFMQPPAPLHLVVKWFPGAQRFGGIPGAWDAWGRSIIGPRSEDLVRRSAVVDGDTVVVGEPVPSVPGRPLTGVLPDGTSTEMVDPDLGAPVGIGEAIEAGTTSTLVSDPLVIATFDGHRIGRICPIADPDAGAASPCPDTAPLAFDVAAPVDQGTLATYFAPLFVEVVDGSITRVTLVSGGISENVWTPGQTSPSDPSIPAPGTTATTTPPATNPAFTTTTTRPPTEPTSSTPVLPPPTSTPPDRFNTIDGPLLRYPFDDGNGMDAIVQGTLALDRECLLLQEVDSSDIVVASYPVVWPVGTRWQPDPPAVVLANGEHVPLGANVNGGGGYLQVNDTATGPWAALNRAAAACVGPTGEVAFFNADETIEVEPD